MNMATSFATVLRSRTHVVSKLGVGRGMYFWLTLVREVPPSHSNFYLKYTDSRGLDDSFDLWGFFAEPLGVDGGAVVD